MTYKEAFSRITRKAALYKKTEDFGDAELLELDAINIIFAYCTEHKYEVNGFPFKLTNNGIDVEDYYELHDSSVFEAYNQYVDFLALEKEDVSKLMWHYTNSFWPNQFNSISDYLGNLKDILSSQTAYDFKL